MCKVTSGSGGATQLKTQDDYDAAIERLLLKVQSARTKAVGLEIRNIVRDRLLMEVKCQTNLLQAKPAAASKKAGKRKRDEEGGLQPLTSSRIVNTHTSTEVPFVLPDSGYVPPAYPPAKPATPPNTPGASPPVSPPFLSFDRLPHLEPSPPSSADLVSWSSGASSGCNVFPSIAEVICKVHEQRPGLQLGNLELDLSFSGVTDSCQLLLVPEEVLSIAGNIGLPQIRIIRNVARQLLLPRLGFRGTYNEPELPEFEVAERHISEEENEGVVEGVD